MNLQMTIDQFIEAIKYVTVEKNVHITLRVLSPL
jgi:hypothetical protein